MTILLCVAIASITSGLLLVKAGPYLHGRTSFQGEGALGSIHFHIILIILVVKSRGNDNVVK